jgi:hypothetical protein
VQRVSISLILQKDYLQTAPKKGGSSDWQMIKTFLNHLGYDVKFVHASISSGMPPSNQGTIVRFPSNRSLNVRK